MKLNVIRAGIFFVAGLVCIIFGKQLNDIKNKFFVKLKWNKFVKDEKKSYIYLGVVFFVIALILLYFGLK